MRHTLVTLIEAKVAIGMQLLQIVAHSYYKSWQPFAITNRGKGYYKSWQLIYYKSWQVLLHIVADITNRGKFITNRCRYYKSWQLLQNVAEHTIEEVEVGRTVAMETAGKGNKTVKFNPAFNFPLQRYRFLPWTIIGHWSSE